MCITETINEVKIDTSGDNLHKKEKYYFYADQYEEPFNRKKDILDPKHCRRGGLPNATDSCNDSKCPGNKFK